jgi:hypothetical protein
MMARSDRSFSKIDALILEYKLLVAGKIVPDAGEDKADIELRLREIEQALLGAQISETASPPELDY